jgi:glycosyltransferase involved in cell wall biosynthesis
MAPDRAGHRILLDALPARFGGGAYAAIRIARHLAMRSDVAQVAVLARPGSIVARGLADAPGVRLIHVDSGAGLELVRRTAWQATRLPALVRGERYDALISMSGMLPRTPGCRVISMLGNPVMYERTTPLTLLRRWAVRRTARGGAHLIAPSGMMAALVSSSAGIRCSALPWGIDHEVFTPPVEAGAEVLCVGDFYAHKRHDLVLAAWCRLAAPRPLLRLIGNAAVDPRAHARIVSTIASLPESQSVVVEEDLPLRELVGAYQRARAFVLASERESFCMPLAEAMACGVPAVVRDLPSLRETGGRGARYVADDDPQRWADVLTPLLADDSEHARARDRALAAAARFSWDAVAAGIVDELERS